MKRRLPYVWKYVYVLPYVCRSMYKRDDLIPLTFCVACHTITYSDPSVLHMHMNVQSNPALSNSVRSPRYFERRSNSLGFTLMFSVITISYFELGYFEFPAISNSSFFPYTLNQPHYFELAKNRVRT